MINPSTNAAATNTATRLSVDVRRNLCLTSSNLKRRLFLTTNCSSRAQLKVTSASSRKCRLYYNPDCEAKRSREQRKFVAAVQQFLVHLVLFLVPRPNQNRTIVFPDFGIVEARFRLRRDQVAMHRKRDIEIAVNCAVNEFDFENVTAFAVANLGNRARLDRLARNM